MPRVPGYEPGQVNINTGGGPQQLRTRVSPEDTGAGLGAAIQQTGEFIRRARAEGFNLRRTELMNKLRDEELKRVEAIQQRKGQDAADPLRNGGKTIAETEAEGLRASFDKMTEGLSLGADERRVLEADFADVQRGLVAKATGHSMREHEAWKASEHETRVSQQILSIQQAADVIDTPVGGAVMLSAKEGLVVLAAEDAKRRGLDPKGAAVAAASLANSVLIEKLIDRGNYGRAKALFDEANKTGELTPKDRARLDTMVNEGASAQRGNAVGVELFRAVSAGTMKETEAFEQIAKMDPKEAQHVERTFRNMKQAEKAQKDRDTEALLQPLFKANVEGRSSSSILQSPEFLKLTALDSELANRFKHGLEVEDRQNEIRRGERGGTAKDLQEDHELWSRYIDIVSNEPLANMSPTQVAQLAATVGPYGRKLMDLYGAATKKMNLWKPAEGLVTSLLMGSQDFVAKGKLNARGQEAKHAVMAQIAQEWSATGRVVEPDQAWVEQRVRALTKEVVVRPYKWFGSDKDRVFNLRAALGSFADANNVTDERAKLMGYISQSFITEAVSHLDQRGLTKGRTPQQIDWAVGKMWLDQLEAGKLRKEDYK